MLGIQDNNIDNDTMGANILDQEEQLMDNNIHLVHGTKGTSGSVRSLLRTLPQLGELGTRPLALNV